MHERRALLLGRQAVQKIIQRHFLLSFRLFAIADPFSAHDNRSAVLRLRKGKDVVLPESHTLSDLKRYRDPAALAQYPIDLFHIHLSQ